MYEHFANAKLAFFSENVISFANIRARIALLHETWYNRNVSAFGSLFSSKECNE